MRNLLFLITGLCSFTLSVLGTDNDTILLETFNKIEVSSEIDAELVLAGINGMQIDFNGIDPGLLIHRTDDRILTLRLKTGSYEKPSVKIRIFFTDLESISSTGRANVWSYEELYLDSIGFYLDNGGSVRLKVVSDHLQAELIQGSILMLSGNAKTLDCRVSSGATFSGYELETEQADVLSNSGGKAKVSVSRQLTAKAVTGGFVGYMGDPDVLETKSSFGGEITRMYEDE